MSAPVAILAIGDMSLRERMRGTLQGLRWKVLEAGGGADALAQLEKGSSSTVIMDTWFPDLEVGEFVQEVESSFPDVELIATDGSFEKKARQRNNRHGELLYPPIDIPSSVSRLMTSVIDKRHLESSTRIRQAMAVFARSEDLVRIGAYKSGSDPELDEAILLRPLIRTFLQQSPEEAAPFDETMSRLHAIAR